MAFRRGQNKKELKENDKPATLKNSQQLDGDIDKQSEQQKLEKSEARKQNIMATAEKLIKMVLPLVLFFSMVFIMAILK